MFRVQRTISQKIRETFNVAYPIGREDEWQAVIEQLSG